MTRRSKLALLPALALAVSVAACGQESGGGSEDAENIKLGVQSGTTSLDVAEERKIEPLEFEDAAKLLQALKSNRIQALLQDLPVITGVGGWDEDKSFSDKYEVAEKIETGNSYGFAVKKDNQALLDVVNQELANAIEDGTWAETYKKWMGVEAPEPPKAESEPGTSKPSDVKLVKEGQLTVCTSLPFPPFQDRPQGEKDVKGFDVDIMDLVAKKLDVKQEILDIKFELYEGGAALNSKKCDIAAAGMTITEERKKNIGFSNPYFNETIGFVTKKGAGVKLDDLAGK